MRLIRKLPLASICRSSTGVDNSGSQLRLPVCPRVASVRFYRVRNRRMPADLFAHSLAAVGAAGQQHPHFIETYVRMAQGPAHLDERSNEHVGAHADDLDLLALREHPGNLSLAVIDAEREHGALPVGG